jgi:hypothetical protein
MFPVRSARLKFDRRARSRSFTLMLRACASCSSHSRWFGSTSERSNLTDGFCSFLILGRLMLRHWLRVNALKGGGILLRRGRAIIPTASRVQSEFAIFIQGRNGKPPDRAAVTSSAKGALTIWRESNGPIYVGPFRLFCLIALDAISNRGAYVSVYGLVPGNRAFHPGLLHDYSPVKGSENFNFDFCLFH